MRRLLPLVLLLTVAACGSSPSSAPTSAPDSASGSAPRSVSNSAAGSAPSGTATSAPPPPPSSGGAAGGTPAPGTMPPPWLGTRVLARAADGYGVVSPTPAALRGRRWTLPDTLPMLPGTGFRSRVEPAPAAVLARSTWSSACPVAAGDLDWIRLTFWGFDGRRHTGELLVAHSASADLVTVFRQLYAAHWPFEQMHITTKAEAAAPPTGDGNNTSAFNCRAVRGQATVLSQHAYGLAIDVDPFQNPYVNGERVLPELASWYLDRTRQSPGIISADGPVVRAFAAVGWGWGGSWQHLKDYEHFSANGR